MRADWVDKHPKAAKALLMAVMEAQQWCDKLENKRGDVRDRRQPRQWFNVPVADIIGRAQGRHQLRQRPQSRRAPQHT